MELVYMKPPKGSLARKLGRLWKLLKCLYGLKQASRMWNSTFTDFLLELGFIQNRADPCIFVLETAQEHMFIGLFVDDLLIVSKNTSGIMWIIGELSRRFKIQHLGEINWYLGIKIERNRKERIMMLSQDTFIESTAEEFGLALAKKPFSPLDPGTRRMIGEDKEETSLNCPYRQAIGKLLYISVCTRPDLAFSIALLSRYLDKPKKIHWNLVKRVIAYLNHTKSYKLVLGGVDGSLKLTGYSDSDWGQDTSTGRSTTGFVFKMGIGSISWMSRLQKTVALSTSEAEYQALATALQEYLYLRNVLAEMKLPGSITEIHVDNQSCIKLAKNPWTNGRSKHINLKYHFVRDLVKENVVKISYLQTEEMIADGFTKPLSGPQHAKFMSRLGLVNSTIGWMLDDCGIAEKHGLPDMEMLSGFDPESSGNNGDYK
jgi:hypothetical protein